VVDGDGWPEGGSRAVQHLLALPQPPTALFCFNDLSAIGAMEAAQAAGGVCLRTYQSWALTISTWRDTLTRR